MGHLPTQFREMPVFLFHDASTSTRGDEDDAEEYHVKKEIDGDERD